MILDTRITIDPEGTLTGDDGRTVGPYETWAAMRDDGSLLLRRADVRVLECMDAPRVAIEGEVQAVTIGEAIERGRLFRVGLALPTTDADATTDDTE